MILTENFLINFFNNNKTTNSSSNTGNQNNKRPPTTSNLLARSMRSRNAEEMEYFAFSG